jgi:prepilin-type N-terminal cleavage/methylation domain-containing protein/prepilin-type processing-associated H-X9-DG protein
MKIPRARSAFTLIELLVVIFVLAILAAILLPATTSHCGPRSTLVICINNLRQVNLSFTMYANDNGGNYPMGVSVKDGGTRDFIYTTHIFPHYEKLAKYKYIPGQQYLICPADKTRKAATNSEAFTDLNISYFLNADCSSTNNPLKSFLAGDRNLMKNGHPVFPGTLIITTNVNLTWSQEIHQNGGSLAFADGHVEFCKSDKFNSIIQRQPLATNRIVIP